MQERGTAYVLQRAFKDNKKFKKAEDIIEDKGTKDGLEKIFTLNDKKLFHFETLNPKTPEGKWLTTYYLQQKKMLDESGQEQRSRLDSTAVSHRMLPRFLRKSNKNAHVC